MPDLPDLHWTSPTHQLIALSIAAIVCIAASNGGTTSQDLKTGYLVGATPKFQQYAILVGSISLALVIGGILIVLNRAGTVYTAKDLPKLAQPLDVGKLTALETAPTTPLPITSGRRWTGTRKKCRRASTWWTTRARSSTSSIRRSTAPESLRRRHASAEILRPRRLSWRCITKGILTQKLPWTLVLLGVAMALVLELSGVPSLPFAVGVYLPLSSSTPIFVGGLMRYIADRAAASPAAARLPRRKTRWARACCFCTGYVAGGTIGEVMITFPVFQRRDSPPVERLAVSADGNRRGRTAPGAVRGRGCRRIGPQDA